MENSKQKKSHPRLPKIKILQTVQKNLTIFGIGPNLAIQPFNEKTLIGLLIIGSGIIDLFYLFTLSETFAEYIQAIYICSAFTLIALVLMVTIFNSNELYKIMNDCECIINISE